MIQFLSICRSQIGCVYVWQQGNGFIVISYRIWNTVRTSAIANPRPERHKTNLLSWELFCCPERDCLTSSSSRRWYNFIKFRRMTFGSTWLCWNPEFNRKDVYEYVFTAATWKRSNILGLESGTIIRNGKGFFTSTDMEIYRMPSVVVYAFVLHK